MKVKIFGHDVDLMNVAKVVAVVASVFTLNDIQKNRITEYIKLHNIEWAEKRKQDSELEQLIENEIREGE